MIVALRSREYNHFSTRMSRFGKYPVAVCILLALSASIVPLSAASRSKLVVLAVDESGSMAQSDPGRMRIEAASMVLSIASPQDDVGVIGFGDAARWVEIPRLAGSRSTDSVRQLGQSNRHTTFHSAVGLFSDFIDRQNQTYRDTHDVVLILFTDGRSDPQDGSPSEDRSKSLELARRIRGRGVIHAISLGREVDRDFLDSLASETGGSSAAADSAGALADAFLQVVTKVYSLPVYSRQDRPGVLQWVGSPDRLLIFFFGDAPGSLSGVSNQIFSSSHIVAAEPDKKPQRCTLDWQGKGTAFLAIRESIRFVPTSGLPSAVLTDIAFPVEMTLMVNDQPAKGPLFLQNSTVAVESKAAHKLQLAPFTSTSGGSFEGSLVWDTPGEYDVTARLSAPYGELKTHLGTMLVSEMPVGLPKQIEIPIFDPLPRSWFSRSIELNSLLPAGITTLNFESGSKSISTVSSGLEVAPSRTARMALQATPSAQAGSVEPLAVSSSWDGGRGRSVRRGIISVYIRQMTAAELALSKWPWTLCALGFSSAIVWVLALIRPRPLRGRLTVVNLVSGECVRLDLPREMSTRLLRIAESRTESRRAPAEVLIRGEHDRSLVTLRSVRRGRHWVCVVDSNGPTGRSAGQHQGRSGRKDSRNSDWCTEDGTIEIKFFPN